MEGLPTPTNVSELRSFLGLCNLYRRFVPHISQKRPSITKWQQKDRQYQLNNLISKEFVALKAFNKKLMSPPILALPRCKGLFTIDTDAYNKQTGCVLTQDQEAGLAKLAGYWLQNLTPAKQAFETTQGVCLTMVLAVLMLHPHLSLTKLATGANHHALESILSFADKIEELERRRWHLSEFDFKASHWLGIIHQATDPS